MVCYSVTCCTMLTHRTTHCIISCASADPSRHKDCAPVDCAFAEWSEWTQPACRPQRCFLVSVWYVTNTRHTFQCIYRLSFGQISVCLRCFRGRPCHQLCTVLIALCGLGRFSALDDALSCFKYLLQTVAQSSCSYSQCMTHHL